MLRTIQSSRDVDSLFQRGSRAANTYVVVIAAPTEPERGPSGRVVFIAGKRIGNAVFRNRCKRVLRASAARLSLDVPGWDIALMARPATAKASPERLDASVVAALQKLGVRS